MQIKAKKVRGSSPEEWTGGRKRAGEAGMVKAGDSIALKYKEKYSALSRGAGNELSKPAYDAG